MSAISLTSSNENGKQLPGVAQPAIQEGALRRQSHPRAHQKRTSASPFHYFNKGDMAVIGRAAAVANIFGIHISGLIAWFIWLFIHLMYIVEFQSRVLVFIQWGFEYLTFSRGARLITGATIGASQAETAPPNPMTLPAQMPPPPPIAPDPPL